MWIKLHRYDAFGEHEVLINTNLVTSFEKINKGTHIILGTANWMTVTETLEEIMERL